MPGLRIELETHSRKVRSKESVTLLAGRLPKERQGKVFCGLIAWRCLTKDCVRSKYVLGDARALSSKELRREGSLN